MGAFCFAQYIADANTCHIALNNQTTGFNVQIPINQVGWMISNLLRVQEAHTQKLFEQTIKHQDEITALKNLTQTTQTKKCSNCNNLGWIYPIAGVNFPAGAVWGVAGAQAMAHQQGKTYLIQCQECNKDLSKPHPRSKCKSNKVSKRDSRKP